MWLNRSTPSMLFCVLALGGCVEAYPAYPQAPPPRDENVPAPPVSSVELSWRPGYYDWNGVNYDWHTGEWMPRAGHSTQWQDGYWQQTGARSYTWVQPGWR